MKKQLLRDVYPELAAQVADKSLLDTLASRDRRKITWICDKGHMWDALVSNRVSKGYGCPYCSGRLAIPGETDLATTNPDIAKQLVDTTLASSLKPTSHKVVNWRCSKGHVWEASVASRVAKDSGCPYCSGRRAIVGETDLATTYPDLAAQLVDKSLGVQLTKGSSKKVIWRCKNGHTWVATPNSRTSADMGCPYCSGREVIAGVNDLLSQRPDIASMLEDTEDASKISVYSNHKYTWHCEKGHTWTAPVSRLTRQGSGCPVCAGKAVKPGENDLVTLVPTIANQLVDTDLGKFLRPKSHAKVTWKCENGHVWTAMVSNRVAFGYGCPVCGSSKTTSVAEKDVLAYVKTLLPNETILCNCRTLLSRGRELDIVIPSKHVAIEFNGIWWHSVDNIGSKTYHFDKSEECTKLGYRLFHIWEDDWVFRQDLVKQYLQKFINGVTDSDLDNVYCNSIMDTIVSYFLETYHLRGYTASDYRFGLYDIDGNMFAVMTGDVDTVNNSFTITRFAAIDNDVSCFRKLLSFSKSVLNVSSVFVESYNDFEDTAVYVTCGFTFDGKRGPVQYDMWGSGHLHRKLHVDDTTSDTGSISIFDSGMVKWKLLL